jgi:hypothetical protein
MPASLKRDAGLIVHHLSHSINTGDQIEFRSRLSKSLPVRLELRQITPDQLELGLEPLMGLVRGSGPRKPIFAHEEAI